MRGRKTTPLADNSCAEAGTNAKPAFADARANAVRGCSISCVRLAAEYPKEKIRFNAVAPGAVDTPLHKDNPKDFLKTLSPMGTISDVKDIVEAVVYLTEARQVTGEVLHVDGGAHSGKW